MSDIQNIAITSTQTVRQTKPHTTYTIQITTPTRTWTVNRRYNDFLSLQAELVSSTGKEPPAALPKKHGWSLTRSVYDDKIIRERRVLLEAYLRAILTTKDPRWRSAYTFSDFLAVPTPRAGSSSNSASGYSASALGIPPPPDHWTPTTWISEQAQVSSLLRSVRSALLKRDALAGMGDANGSRSSSVEAKRLLKDVGIRLEGLEKGLTAIGSTGGLGDGEKRRREEMVENMKAERGNLQRMAEAGVRTSGFSRPGIGDAGGGSAGSTGGNGTMPGGTASPWGPPPPSTGRVFGSRPVPSETVETRPLDDRGLLQLQQTKMAGQDAQLGELSKVLVRQREMGEVIAKEIGEQNELLEELEGEVDRTGRKLGRAKREMNRLG